MKPQLVELKCYDIMYTSIEELFIPFIKYNRGEENQDKIEEFFKHQLIGYDIGITNFFDKYDDVHTVVEFYGGFDLRYLIDIRTYAHHFFKRYENYSLSILSKYTYYDYDKTLTMARLYKVIE